MLLGHTNPKISASVKLLTSGFVSNGQKSLVLHVASISTTIKTFKLLLCNWLNSLCKFIFFSGSKLTLLPLMKVKAIDCCIKLCFGALALSVMTDVRNAFQALSMKEQTQELLRYFTKHSAEIDGKYHYLYTIGTAIVCDFAFRTVLGISKSRFYDLRARCRGNKILYFTWFSMGVGVGYMFLWRSFT